MQRFDALGQFDKTAEVQNRVDEVKNVMHDNVKKILETHANIETLQDKTENLASSASQFNRSAGDLRRIMWWRKIKVSIILGIVVTALIVYVALIIARLV
eukprot:GHVT01030777.1.p2 GENE.GHVT01030777.1~~GHVT01030777.1.p2  ORF type:complete len:100 (+),score=19.74 GHVT01030777.1:1566-1865(+)